MAVGKVLVLGALHLDVVVTAPRLPRLDETLMGGSVDYLCGGKGCNQAVAARRHGAATAMAGRIGDDAFGQRLIGHLTSAGVDTTLIQRGVDTPSGMSTAIVNDDGDYGAVVVSAANRDCDPSLLDVPPDTSILVTQNEIPEACNLAAARLAKERGVTVVHNAAPMRAMAEGFLTLVDIIIVNRVEAEMLFAASTETDTDVAAAMQDRADGPPFAIVTLGGDGVVVHRRGEPATRHAAFDVPVISTHGAGDVFVGALCARLVVDEPLEDALRYAQAAAALYVSAPAASRSDIRREDVMRFLNDRGA